MFTSLFILSILNQRKSPVVTTYQCLFSLHLCFLFVLSIKKIVELNKRNEI